MKKRTRKESAEPVVSRSGNFSLATIMHFITTKWFLLLNIGLLAAVVLLPKIPLFDIIPGYIVRARTEDFLVLFALLIYGVQLWRRKVPFWSPVTGVFIFYAIVGVLSILNAMFVVETLPLNLLHVGKMVLHFARRIEYVSLFFLFYASVKTRQDLKVVLIGIVLILIGVTVYGYGQKYLYWPVYSTMNREFSKGLRLVLTEKARVPSTFGGHYDMSAFTMMVITILLSVLFFVRSKVVKVILTVVSGAAFWLLILGASRSSFLAYLLAIGVLVCMIGIYKRSFVWMVSRGVVVLGLSLFVMISFGDLSSRFTQLGFIQDLNKKVEGILKPAMTPPPNAIAVDPLTPTDQQPIPVVTPSPEPNATASATAAPLPPDVYTNIPDIKTVTSTEGGKTVTKIVEVPRTYTDCTFIYGLSACIRFDTLWPRAIKGFLRNPLLGSGYSTLTKGTKDEFTEAESTDNDFLRNLGETGIAGVIGFYGAIAILFWKVIARMEEEQDTVVIGFLFGLVAGTLGMLFNGLYIDVFEASKVAFTFWALYGVAFASLAMKTERITSHKNNKREQAI